jgi:hypothetical protein
MCASIGYPITTVVDAIAIWLKFSFCWVYKKLEPIISSKTDPYMSDGEIWTAHGDVNPCGLVVRRGGI